MTTSPVPVLAFAPFLTTDRDFGAEKGFFSYRVPLLRPAASNKVIADILPPKIVVRETVDDDAEAPLFAEEETALGFAVAPRRQEFATARNCARRALARLGLPRGPLLPGLDREPLWPSGVVGSITHCNGYRAAAVARREDFLSIGIDAEPHGELPKDVLASVALPEEQAWLKTRSGEGVCWDRVLFSAKESVYKAWFPLAGRWLGFEDALIHINPQNGTFHARLLVPGPFVDGLRIDGFEGRFCIANQFVFSFAGIAARAVEHAAPRIAEAQPLIAS